MWSRFRPRTFALLTALATALLILLAALQVHWLREMSDAQETLLRAGLERSVDRFAEDFDREITRLAFVAQAVGLGAGPCGAILERWRELAPFPELMAGLHRVRPGPDGPLGLATCTGDEWTPAPWPAALVPLRPRLTAGEEGRPLVILADDVPALVLPAPGGFSRQRRGRHPDAALRRLTIVHLDAAVLEERLLPELSLRHFGAQALASDAPEVHLRIHPLADPERTVFEHGPRPRRASAGGDATSELFGLLSFDQIRRLMVDVGRLEADPVEHAGEADTRRRRRGRWTFGPGPPSGGERRWRLVVTHPDGSLEAASAAVRRRNLAIGLGALGVLGGAALLALAAARHTHQLARRELELIAGVTHELRTPLTALRSAGSNLASGVVQDPQGVARYGALIERESERLGELVEQVLADAGLRSGQRTQERQRIAPSEVVAKTLADFAPLLEQAGFTVDTDLAGDLPELVADRAALERALGNLVSNAVKHAAAGRSLEIRAARRGDEVEIRVADRGPGIAPVDLPRLFEPFYRGRGLAASRVPGSGLGLSLVRRICEGHGGRVSAANRAGGGAEITLRLPAAAGQTEPSGAPCAA